MRSYFAALFIACSLSAQEAESPALTGLDPVELCRGKERFGGAEIVATHGRYRYRFATYANQKAFLADPERYAIQMGGGCARMGPLSGIGDPGRFAVHEGRIYIFASDGCRAGFRKAPERHISVDEIASEGDAGRGRRLLARARSWIAGEAQADALASLANYRARLLKTQKSAGKNVETGEEVVLAWSGERNPSVRRQRWWGDWRRVDVANADTGFVVERSDGKDDVCAHTTGQRACVERLAGRELLAVLRIGASKKAVVVAVGDTAGDIARVAVTHRGATNTLGIDAKTGRVLELSYRGRYGIGPLADVRIVFEDWRRVGSMRLPHTLAVTKDGKAQPERVYTSFEVNVELAEDTFTYPSKKSR